MTEHIGPARAEADSTNTGSTDPDLLRSRTGAVWLERDFIAVAGHDALKFLQGQLSQDVDLAVGASTWALLLAPQGKVVALLRVLRAGAEEFVLDTDAGWSHVVLERLTRFKLRVACDLSERDWRCLALRGPEASQLAAATAVAPDAGEERVAYAVTADWPGLPGADLVGPNPQIPAGVELVPLERYEAARIEAGVPVMGHELTESTIPAEAGVVDRSVSFTKGCYTGQELVARIDSRGGNVPRRLRGVVLDGGADRPAPPLGTPLEVAGVEVGVLTSVAWSPVRQAYLGLAYVRRGIEVPAQGCLGAGIGTAIRIETLPLVS